MTPKVLAFLQNIWVRDPARVNAIYERHGEGKRADINARLLMAGGKTGTILKQVFGGLSDRIVWEEASPTIGGQSSAAPPADPAHIDKVIEAHKPDIVLSFGKVASGALRKIKDGGATWDLITGPHPTARQPDVMIRLSKMQEDLRRLLKNYEEI